jgi:hypothetical protein
VTSVISTQHSCRLSAAADYPMAYHGHMQEVFGRMTDKVSVPRSSIVDIVFILPIKEVESGM